MREIMKGLIIREEVIKKEDLKKEKEVLCNFKREKAMNFEFPLKEDNVCCAILTGRQPNGRHLIVTDFDLLPNTNFNSFHPFLPKIFVDTFSVKTGSGGFHFYFHCPSNTSFSVKNIHPVWKRKGLKGIDVKGNGGLVIAPPTKLAHHPHKYEILYNKPIQLISTSGLDELIRSFAPSPRNTTPPPSPTKKQNTLHIIHTASTLRPCVKYFIENIDKIDDFSHEDAVIVAYDLFTRNYTIEQVESIFSKSKKALRPDAEKKRQYQINYIYTRIKKMCLNPYSCKKTREISLFLKNFCENSNCFNKHF